LLTLLLTIRVVLRTYIQGVDTHAAFMATLTSYEQYEILHTISGDVRALLARSIGLGQSHAFGTGIACGKRIGVRAAHQHATTLGRRLTSH
jgi:hypothetical protein